MPSYPADQSSTRRPRSERVLDAIDTARAEWEEHPERRRTPRGVPGFEPSRAQLVSATLESYKEMPGLTLFVPQAALLFGVSTRTCQLMLDDLVNDRRLRRDTRGQYVL